MDPNIREDREARAAYVRDFGAALAVALTRTTGDQYRPAATDADDTRSGRFVLDRAHDGLRITGAFDVYGFKNRLRLSTWTVQSTDGTKRLNVHDGRRHGEPSEDITAADTKTPAQVAKDAARRMLPLANKYAAQVRADHDAETTRAAKQTNEAQMLRDAAPWPLADHWENKDARNRRTKYYTTGNPLRVDLTVTHDGTAAAVDLDLHSMTPEQTLRVFAALRDA